MKTESVSAQNFNGKLYVVNKLSKKPSQCIKKETSNLLKLIKKEKFDLYIKQDYSANKINIVATAKTDPQIYSSNEVLATANPSQYLAAAEKSVESYAKVRDDYFYNEYQRNKSFTEKFFDFLNAVLDVNNWGK